MAYNYAKEKRKFDAEWKRKASWYRKDMPYLFVKSSVALNLS